MKNYYGTRPESQAETEALHAANKQVIESIAASKKIALNNFAKEQAEIFNASHPRQEPTGLTPEELATNIAKQSSAGTAHRAELLLLKQRSDELKQAGIS